MYVFFLKTVLLYQRIGIFKHGIKSRRFYETDKLLHMNTTWAMYFSACLEFMYVHMFKDEKRFFPLDFYPDVKKCKSQNVK
jgi:hypothetical protein